MSMLVGVRGQTRESEGPGLREGIIQQPGPFYNGNPSSIIWGNSPTAPLWREESGSPFSTSSTSLGFGISKQQQSVQKEEKEKNVAGMVAGEVRASSKGRRHVIRTQLGRNLNPNPSPSSPFAFGFPPQTPPPGSASSSVPGSGQPRVPTFGASGGAFVAFGSRNNFTPGTSGKGAVPSGLSRPGATPSAQDERMEDIEEVIPVLAHLTVNDHQCGSKFPVKADELITSSGVAQDVSPSWGTASDVNGKFSTLGLNDSPPEPSVDRKDAPGVFVFGSKSTGKEAAVAAAPLNPSAVPAPPARPRPVKVKRSVSATKGKGVAAGNNDALSAPSPKGLHVEGSQFVSGECSLSQPTPPGLGIPPVGDAAYSSHDSASKGFAPSPLPILAQKDFVSEGLHQSSSSSRRSGHEKFVFGQIAKGSNSSRESNLRSDLCNVAGVSFKASTMGNDLSMSLSASRKVYIRNSSTKGSIDEIVRSSRSLNFSLASALSDASKNVCGELEFAPGHFDVKGRVHSVDDLSSDLALKLGIGSIGIHAGKDVPADSKSSKPSSTETGGLPRDKTLAAPNGATPGGKRDGESVQLSSSPTNTIESLRMAKEATVGVRQKPTFHSFTQIQPEPDPVHEQAKPFVFGASRPQSTSSTRPEALAPSPTFKFAATSSPSSPSLSSSTGGGCVSRSASISVSDLLKFKHKGSATYDSSTTASQPDADALTSSFSSFNLGAPKPSVKADGESKSQGVFPDLKKSTAPIPSLATGSKVKDDSDDGSSYICAPFVFSAGSGFTSSSQAAPQVTPAENKLKEKIFPVDTNVISDFFEAQSSTEPNNMSSKSFEFRANSEGGGGVAKNAARKKSHRTQVSGPRRQSRSAATSKEKKNSLTPINFVNKPGNADEAGSPMDFSPQRYTPPHDTIHEMEQTPKQAGWSQNSSMEKDGLDGDDEWTQYSETDVAMENLRNAANDLTLGSKQGSRATWEGIGKGEDESFWWGGKENSPGKTAGRHDNWKWSVFDENQVPLGGRDNTWSDIKVDAANEPESAATSSTHSVDSSASSSGWGHFTFTAGSSPNFSSTTSFLRRHARRIQRERSGQVSAEVMKTRNSKSRGESTSLPQAGVKGLVGNASAAAVVTSTMSRPVFSFDTKVNPPGESVKGSNGRGGNWDQVKVPNVMFSSRSNSWSTESSSSLGSLPKADVTGPISPQTAGAAATEQVCERWRLRGNQAYANGDFPKAEEYYSRGASSVPPNETSQSCIRASMLCYSNRAATRMVVGRMREALADCMRAMAVDPNFLRVRLRAASCHLALGEIDSAVLAFKECIRHAKEDDQPDVKVSSEASEGLRKSLQVEEYLGRASEILANWSSGDTPTALRLLNEALLSSPHLEQALELKCRALLVLRRYDEVVQLCEQSLVTAERNHPLPSSDSMNHQLLQATSGGDMAKQPGSATVLWRWQLTGKAKFHLGQLEDALETLQKADEMASVFTPEKAIPTSTSSAILIATIRDLLRHKAAGNDAFQSGKHSEAVEHYSAALACNGDSRPFNAVCFCNRAAASQALANIGDAISDCSRAIALDPKYAKAISRRATLHEKLRDYGQSCHDLQRLITLLEGQQQQARVTLSPGRVGRVTPNTQQDLRQARDRLAKAENEMKKGHPLDHYMILGLEPGCSSNEIKKAYRKAALRHHPDKAGQFLGRSEGGDDGGMWKEVADEVRRDAERLFKLIGEANAMLSDTQKRTRYDAEEEFRKLRTQTGNSMGDVSEMCRNAMRGQGAAGRRPRDRWDPSWSGYAQQHQRWQSGPDAAQPDTYARRGRYGSNNSSRSNGEGGRNDYDWDDM